MTPTQISRLIEEDLDRNGQSLSRGALKEGLCEPRKIRVRDASDNDKLSEVWLVFEERASAREGYKVVYPEKKGQFGLASSSDGTPVLIGIYGNFLEALRAM